MSTEPSQVIGRRLSRPLLALAGLLLWTASPTHSQQDHQNSALRLGTVEFENSGATEAQEAFTRGLLLMHSFQYEQAASAFRAARRIDPSFAMATWGEAMTYNHPVWMQQDREAAREALNRLAPTPEQRAAKAGTPREAAYMRAVDVLFGEGDKRARDFAYADAMAALRAAYPEDEDAAAFHALALLGTAHEGRDFATYMRAAAILEEVVDRYPDHPGIVHYLIHAYDDPIHAPLGLRAARAYSLIAPDAPHAQHMTSHIFMALGMWDEVVRANENAMRVVNAERARRGESTAACGHYNFWLEYGYLQQGRAEDAVRLLRECRARVLQSEGGDDPDPDNTPVGSYSRMLARYVIDSGDDEALNWPVELAASPHARTTHTFARGYTAAVSGDAEAVRSALNELRTIDAELSATSEKRQATGDRRQVLLLELEAMVRALGDDWDAAIALARQATDIEAAMPLEFGPPFVDKPSFELLGDLLLAADRASEARAAYRTALSRTPRRVAAAAGLAVTE